ncbi:hypothetical protein [Lawsonibacter hominis]|uniref:hypothetical protein n=1 Tax=Lawsonibacter hominis TaxID=2763053 RepID=UPI001A9BBEAC|nr:hypothetical protein [Lawsonibacter hominis]
MLQSRHTNPKRAKSRRELRLTEFPAAFCSWSGQVMLHNHFILCHTNPIKEEAGETAWNDFN